jgi:hypothetical protein
MWRKQWERHRRGRKFANREEYERQWKSANTWYRLFGRFRLFGGRLARFLSYLNQKIRRITKWKE